MPVFTAGDFQVYDDVDQTKYVKFDNSGLPTSTTLILTAPSYGGNAVLTLPAAEGTAGQSLISGGGGGNFAVWGDRVKWTGTPSSGQVTTWNANGEIKGSSNFTVSGTTLTAVDLVGSTSLKVGGGATLTALTAGTYTPTRSAEANLDANVTPTQAQYLQVGNTVTVSGRVTGVDPTTTLTTTSFELTLPVASNLGAANDLCGVAFCGAIAGQGRRSPARLPTIPRSSLGKLLTSHPSHGATITHTQ